MSTPPNPPPPPLSLTLRPYQAEVARAVLASIRQRLGISFSVMISRQGGKNELSALLERHLLLQHHATAMENVKAAPTFDPQGRVSLRRLWTRLSDAGLAALARVEQGNCVRVGQARQFFLSAAPEASVVGHTCHQLLEVDEAQDVDAESFDKRFRPMAAANNATTVYYGTAWSASDLLAQVSHQHLALERRDGVRRHFSFDWQVVARAVPAYAAFVDHERARLGEDHPLFRTQYLLQPIAGGGRLFSSAQRALVRGDHARLSAPPATQGAETLGYVAGLDVGGEALGSARDHDWTVLTIARVVAPRADAVTPEPNIEVVEHAAWQGVAHADLMRGLGRLLFAVWRVRRVVIDATGVGEGIASALVAMAGRGAAADVARLRLTEERKSALGHSLLAATNSGRLRLYAADGSAEARELWRELELARVEHRSGQRLAWFVDSKDGHDDYLMSLALAVEAARDLTPRVARGRLPDGGSEWDAVKDATRRRGGA